ncbi:beta strand repeat-containing protein, partial [Methylobacterium aquaticum]
KAGSLSIDAGDGTNTVTLDGDITVVDAAQITTGGDDDTVTLTGTVKAGSLAIMAGEGTNRVALDGGFTVAGELAVVTGGGRDSITLTGMYGSVSGGVAGLGSLRIDAGGGSNTVSLTGEYAINGSARITTGGSDDTISLTGRYTAASMTIDAGEGVNTVDIDADLAVAGALAVRTGSDADAITVAGAVKAGSMEVTASSGSGDGRNTITLVSVTTVAGALTIQGGSGIDTLTDTTLVAGAVRTSAIVTAGSVAIALGDGTNGVTLASRWTASGAFTLETGADADTITDAVSANGAVLQKATIQAGSIAIRAGAGDTVITLLGSTVAASTLAVTTLGGRDRVTLRGRLRSTTTDIALGAGDDVLDAELVEIAGNTRILGEDGQDTITITRLPPLSSATNGRRDTLDIDGGQDTDTVLIQLAGSSSYRINVHDSGDADRGVDALTILGTDGDDTFLARRNLVALVHPNADGTDPADAAVERITVDGSLNGRILVEGGLGDDHFAIDDTVPLTIDGGVGDDTFQVGQVFATPRDVADGVLAEDAFDTVPLSFDGWLSKGNSVPTVIKGGTGNDTVQVYSNSADLYLDGEDGDDTVVVRSFALAGSGPATVAYSVNAPLHVDGGSGVNKVVVLGTEAADAFLVTQDGVFGAGLSITPRNVQAIEVDGLEGDDTISVRSTAAGVVTTLIGGLGSDTVLAAGDVSGQVVSRDGTGGSAVINHTVTSADMRYDGLAVAGIDVTVATDQSRLIGGGHDLTVWEDSADTTPDAAGSRVATYTVAPPPPATTALTATDVAVVTVSAEQSSAQMRALAGNAGTVEVSLDGITYADSLTVTFTTVSDGTGGYVWSASRTVYVRAKSDSAAEGDRIVAIGHSVISSNAEIDGAALNTVMVTVIDDDTPSLIITQTDGDTTVIEGTRPQQADRYTVALNTQPRPGETVTVTLSTTSGRIRLTRADGSALPVDADGNAVLTFTAANWNVAQTVMVSAPPDDQVQARQIVQITHRVTSSLGAAGFFGSMADAPVLNVTVVDGTSAGVLVRPAPGGVTVTETRTSSYDVVLTAAPTAPVTLTLEDDGQTILSSDDPRFTAAAAGRPATVTFGPDNYDTPIRITVARDPQGAKTRTDLKTVSRQPHDVGSIIQGPLVLQGGVGPQDRGLQQALALPGEENAAVARRIAASSQPDLDRLTVSNDTTTLGVAGTLEADHIGGLGMPAADLVVGGVTTRGGITYAGMNVVQVLLGQGNDTVMVASTATGTLTEIHGGGGADTLTVTGSTGLLALFGDTTADHSRYDSTPEIPTGRAYAFRREGMVGVDGRPVSLADRIDASGATGIVMIDGGAGDDVLIGGQGRTFIAGGSGNDTITGSPVADVILGDSAFNLSAATRILTIDDTGAAGADTIDAGAGANVVIGDHGQLYQDGLPTPQLFLEGTHLLSRAVSTNLAAGAGDTITTMAGDTVIIGGVGADRITVGTGNHVILGDNGDAVFTNGVLTSISTLSGTIGGDDTISAQDGDSVILGGAGADRITLGKGKQVILGDTGAATFTLVDGVRVLATIATLDGEAAIGGADTIQADDGDATIIGGAGADRITVGTGNHVILGDNGQATFAAGRLSAIASIDPEIGGDDAITARDGSSTILGGAGSDAITLGSGHAGGVGGN